MRLDVKWRVGLVALVALGLLGSAAYAAVLRGSESAAKPSLTVTPGAPLGVSGRGFKSGERVRVTANGAKGQVRRAIAANRSGRFTARFPATFANCGPLYIVAVGTRGSRATLRIRGVPPPCGMEPAPDLQLNG